MRGFEAPSPASSYGSLRADDRIESPARRALARLEDQTATASTSMPNRLRPMPDPTSVLSLSGNNFTWHEDAENIVEDRVPSRTSSPAPLSVSQRSFSSGSGLKGLASGITRSRSMIMGLNNGEPSDQSFPVPELPKRVQTPPASPIVDRQRREREANQFLVEERQRRREGREERPVFDPDAERDRREEERRQADEQRKRADEERRRAAAAVTAALEERSRAEAAAAAVSEAPGTPRGKSRRTSDTLKRADSAKRSLKPQILAVAEDREESHEASSDRASSRASDRSAGRPPHPQLHTLDTRQTSAHSITGGGPPSSEGGKITITYQNSMDDISPASGIGEEPIRVHWQKDDDVTACPCGREFGFFVRKHHCRICGRIFCAQCSAFTLKLNMYAQPHSQGMPCRVCGPCFKAALESVGPAADQVTASNSSLDGILDTVQLVLGVKLDAKGKTPRKPSSSTTLAS